MNEIQAAHADRLRQLHEEIIGAGREWQETGRSPPGREPDQASDNGDIVEGINLFYELLQQL
jgi:hypothetical protein